MRQGVKYFAAAAIGVLLAPGHGLKAATASRSQSVSASFAPAAKLSVPAEIVMTASPMAFGSASGQIALAYRVRTRPSGNGQLTIQFVEFSPSGGPSIDAGDLTFTCSAATLGTPCSGTKTASTKAATQILDIPAGSCTGGGTPCGGDPHTMQVGFSLSNDPGYSIGQYSAQVTFTISAT